MVENKISPSDLLSPSQVFLAVSINLHLDVINVEQANQTRQKPPKKTNNKRVKKNTEFQKRDSQNIFLLVIY